MAAPLVELTATLTDVRWPPNCDTFFIATLKVTEESDAAKLPSGVSRFSITGVGNANQDELKPHLTYRWFGRWADNERFGPQFKIDTWTPAKPHGKTGVVKYLQQCDGIGEATALQIWNEFQADAVRICREHPEIIAAKIKRLNIDAAKLVAKQLADMSDLENTSIDLIEALNGRGFPKATAREAMRVWGAKAPAVINADPYKLMRFRGCGFMKCDKMWLDLGLPAGRMKRQVCCAWHAIATERKGNVWLPIARAVEGLNAQIAGVKTEPDKAIAIARRFGALSVRRDCWQCQGTGIVRRENLFTGDEEQATCGKCGGSGGSEWIAETKRARAEQRVVEKIADMLDWERHWPRIEGPCFERLTEHQRAELSAATSGAVGAFCGSPGSGKTFSLAALVRLLVKSHGPHSVAICAPTGKAARRAREAMRGQGIDVEATTIHRLLGVEKADEGGDGWSFVHGEGNALPYRFVICDESSMIGLGLMASLLAALDRGTNLLFVGDVNQLLPVEFGAPLRDLIGHVPYGELKEIHRNSGSVVRACAAIRDKRPVVFDAKIDTQADPPKNLALVTAEGPQAQAKLLALVKELASQPASGGNGFSPIRDIQVLVAVNKKSPLSRKTLSPLLQDILNPHGRTVAGSPFRVGDKVMQTKNSLLKLRDPLSCPDANAEGKVLVANGEFGTVLEVEATRTVVEFFNPTRVVVIPKGKSSSNKPNEKTRDEGGDDSEESDGTGCDLVLGYAVTCHKLQGSSAHTIIVALDESPGASGPYGVMDRSWVYTAISRTEQRCYVIGKREVLQAVCGRSFITHRKTFTRELLVAELASRLNRLITTPVDTLPTSGGVGAACEVLP